MLKFILKLIFGDYNHRIARSMSAFTKIIDKATKLNEEMRADIYKKEAKIAELNADINDINNSINRNTKFITNVQKLTE
jgi:predicted DNA-binding ArsR family transcriptional regulator